VFTRANSLIALAVAAAAVAACAGRGAVTPAPPGSQGPLSAASNGAKVHSPIKHIVLLIQENRSFDNLFQGYPGANTQSYGMAVPVPNCLATPVPGTTPVAVTLSPIPLEAPYDLSHGRDDWALDYDNGKMDGFNHECPSAPTSPYPQYGYVPRSEVQPYWTLAGQYVLADRMFQSNIDGSFVAHQFLIAAQANREVDYPNGPWGCSKAGVTVRQLLPDPNPSHLFATSPPVPACENYPTLGDELRKIHKTWRIYSYQGPPQFGATIPSDWNGFQAISHIYHNKKYLTHYQFNPDKILTDIAAGTLADMTWVTPIEKTSDHAGFGYNQGPAWIASVVNAIGTSKFWNSTVVFVVWDDWGGWYDHVVPPDLDYDGLGFRVPLLIISPYTPQGVIADNQLEFGSILRYVENLWGLAQLSASDTRAIPADQGCPASNPCINPNVSPRPFQTIPSQYDAKHFIGLKSDGKPLDSQ